MKRFARSVFYIFLFLIEAFCLLTAAEKTVILDSYSSWRIYNVFKAPVILSGSSIKSLNHNMVWLDRDTQPPPANWLSSDFDDHLWTRGSIYSAGYTPWLSKLCLRGKFLVKDPTAVKELKINAAFHGGAVIYVNGQEAARVKIKKGAELAEPYPPEAFLAGDGSLLLAEKENSLKPEDPKKLMRRRVLSAVPVPSSLLVKGVNIIECEIIRAPYAPVVDEKKNQKNKIWNFAWNTCYLESLELSSFGGEALVPCVARPEGFQVWNNNLLANDYDMDFGDRNEKLYPIEISGAKNGSFSGKVVLGSTKPLSGISVIASDLKGSAGVIPSAQIMIRYGYPWGGDMQIVSNTTPFLSTYPAETVMLGSISEDSPVTVPVSKNKALRFTPVTPVPRIPGAVLPVYFTVQIPKDAATGNYSGMINIKVAGEKPVTVPLELKVSEWTLPDTGNFKTWVEIIQSPDTLALEYNVPLWSEKHFELIGKSLKLIGESGSRVLYVPLIAETNYGHGETMVRWINKGDKKYDYDFSIMDKYLDLAEKNMGKPKMVVFFVWDVYMMQSNHESGATAGHEEERILEKRKKENVAASGPVVTVLNAGKTEKLILPMYTDSSSKALWQGLTEELKKNMKKRGLENVMTLGMMNDAWPTKPEVAFWAGLLPGVPWIVHAHFGAGTNAYGLAPITYQTRVWSIKDAAAESLMGWKSGAVNLLGRYNRDSEFDNYPNSTWRSYAERAITGDQRGVGRIGGDFWKVLKDKKGERSGRVYSRYPQSNWRNLDIYNSMLTPGPGGPGICNHYLLLVEGVFDCEARIVLEHALSDESKKYLLGKELKERCEKVLSERLQAVSLNNSSMFNRFGQAPTTPPGIAANSWFIGSGWQARSETLFSLAAEVEKKLGKKQ